MATVDAHQATEELDDKYQTLIIKFITDLRNGKLEGSSNIALAAVSLLEQIVSDSQNISAIKLVERVTAAGRLISNLAPGELTAANIVRRVLRLIRDEHSQMGGGCEGGDSLQRLVTGAGRRNTLTPSLATPITPDLTSPTLQHMAELRTEIETSVEGIVEQAPQHIHPDELVLTYGASSLCEKFLRRAAKTCRYRLLILQGTETSEVSAMARRLSTAGVLVAVAGVSAAGGVVSRAHKVLLGARAVLAAGKVLASAGAALVARAARMHAVPVIILSPLYKLSPSHWSGRLHSESLMSPASALNYVNGAGRGETQIFAPQYELVPADLVTLFLTNL